MESACINVMVMTVLLASQLLQRQCYKKKKSHFNLFRWKGNFQPCLSKLQPTFKVKINWVVR